MNVMTSCSLRPASRARNPPMAWMPSWEFPAIRMTVSEIFGVLGALGAAVVVSLMEYRLKVLIGSRELFLKLSRSATSVFADGSRYHCSMHCQMIIQNA